MYIEIEEKKRSTRVALPTQIIRISNSGIRIFSKNTKKNKLDNILYLF